MTGLDGTHHPVVVVGGGQAGLSASWYLQQAGVDHVVLEAERLGHEWRDRRWESFCLVTPNWQCQLPGFPYAGADPDGFMVRAEILDYLAAFVASFGPPVREGIRVTGLHGRGEGGYAVTTDAGTLSADAVILATGPYHLPVVPPLADRFPAGLTQLHSSAYRAPEALPDGAVLVVGTGQSGAQVAEDLHRAGRVVHLAVGSAPRVSRAYRGRDVVAWLEDMGYYRQTVAEHPLGHGVRDRANHYVTGRDGGHDIDLRAFAREGMAVHGRLLDVSHGVARFGDGLAADLDHADRVSDDIKDSIDAWIDEHGVDAPSEARYVPVWAPGDEPREVDLVAADVGTVIWATGYRPDYGWVEVDILDAEGYPTHDRGVTAVPGIYVLGLPWLHTWGSARFAGIATDAAHVVGHLLDDRVPAPQAELNPA